MTRQLAIAILFGVALGFGCADLPEVAEGVCGNLVLDQDEDCDHYTDYGDGTACGEAETENACRYICDAAEGIVCPDGWGCGDDGQCRRPAGTYDQAAGSPWRFAVKDFAIGDVDGDGHADLIGNEPSAIFVRFGSGDGEFPADLDALIRVPTGPLEYGYFDDDERFDAAVPTASGLFVLLGREERTLEPVAYAPFEIEQKGAVEIIGVESSPANLSTEMLLLAHDEEAGSSYMWFIDSSQSGVLFPGGYSFADLAGDVPVADIDHDTEMRSEFALAFRGATQLWVFTSEGTVGTFGINLRPVLYQQIALPGPILDGARFADVDGNGTLDLMVSIEDNTGKPRVAVCYIGGLGGIAEPTVENVFDRGVASPWPIAAGNLAGSAKADYVYPEAVYITDLGLSSVAGPPQTITATAFAAAMPWAEAVIGDFNGDDLRDVAAAVEGWDGLELLINSNSVFFNRFYSDTENPPTMLRVGDFDGDRVADVGFAETGFGNWPDSISVVFGSTSGGPSEPVSMGQLGYLESMHQLHNVPSFEAIDAITDLVLVSQSVKDSGSRRVAVLHGSSSRRMISPFTLQPEDGDSSDVPRGILFGDFDDDGIRDIVSVAEIAMNTSVTGTDDDNAKRPHHLWLVPGEIGDGSLDAGRTDYIEAPEHAQFDCGCAKWAAGDLRGTDGRHEVVAIDNDVECYGLGASPAPHLAVVRSKPGEAEVIDVSIQELPGTFRAVRDVALRDLDADGDLDLLALFAGEARAADVGLPEGAAVVVLWNEAGNLSLSDITALDIPDVGALYDVAPLHTNADLVPELAVLTDKGVLVATLDQANHTYALEPSNIVERLGAGRLEVADLNGDGLEDMAITAGSQVHVLLGSPDGLLGRE